MSAGPIYNLTLEAIYDSTQQKEVDAYTIDRMPLGDLSTYTSVMSDSDRYGPCGRPAGAIQPQRENRYKISLPPSVRTTYSHLTNNKYVDRNTLPGMFTWLEENGYDYVNFKHVVELDLGIWIRYSDGAGVDEFRGREVDTARAVPRLHAFRPKPPTEAAAAAPTSGPKPRVVKSTLVVRRGRR